MPNFRMSDEGRASIQHVSAGRNPRHTSRHTGRSGVPTWISCVALALVALASPRWVQAQTPTPPDALAAQRPVSLPLSFERIPQKASGAEDSFTTRSPRATLTLRNDAIDIASREMSAGSDRRHASPVRLAFAGHRRAGVMSGENPLPGRIYHAKEPFTGPLTGNPTFARVRYSQLYDGIDAIFYGNDRQLEFDFQIAPHADPDQIELSLTGADGVALESSGDLTFRSGAQYIRLNKPVMYQVHNGVRHEVAGGYDLSRDGSRVRFHVGRYDGDRPLVIDPTISFATYFGGTGDERASQVRVDPAGDIYLLATTTAPDALPPHQSFPIPVVGFASECFLTKLAPGASSVLYTVVFDGGFCGAMDLGTSGLVHLGLSYSLRTLTESGMSLGPLQGGYNLGPADGSVSLLRTDSSGNVYFVTTYAPTDGSAAIFVFELRKVDRNGQLVFHAPVLPELDLANFEDQVQALDVDDHDRAYIVGTVRSDGAVTPTPDAFQPVKSASSQDGFLLKVNTGITAPPQNPIEYATFLGGSQDDFLNAVLFDAATNSVLVSGFSASPDFPTTAGAFAPAYTVFTTNPEAVIAKLDLNRPAAQQMVFGTYLGARSTSFTLSLLPGGFPVISGYTFDHVASATDPVFPLVNSYYPAVSSANGRARNYLGIFSPDASSLLFSTFLTPTLNAEFGVPHVATNGSQTLYVLTDVNVDGLGTGSTFQPINAGGYDLLLRALDVSDLVAGSGADLSVTAAALPTPAFVGSALTYSVVTKNLGPKQADGVTVTLAFGSSVTFQGAATQGAVSCTPGAGTSTSAIACDLGTLAAGGVANLDISVVPQTQGSEDVVIHVSSSTSDPNATNDSASIATTVNAALAHTTTVVASSLNPSVAGQSVAFTATVTGSSPGGTVTFTDAGNPIGAAVPLAGGTASLTIATLTVGTHTIGATYSGDSLNLGSTAPVLTQTVAPPVVAGVVLTSSANPSTAGQSVTFTATVSGVNATGTVTFMDGSSTLGTMTLNGGGASLSTATLTAGIHSLTASYSGDVSNLAGASSVLTQTVNPTYSIIDLGAIGGGESSGWAISNNGQVAGQSTTSASGPGSIEPHAFVISAPYTDMIDLGTLGSDLASSGQGINFFGQVTGYSMFTANNGQPRAFVIGPPYTNMFSLGTLGGRFSSAAAINDLGQVTGESETVDEVRHAFLWDGTLHDIGTLTGNLGGSSGLGVNASGLITGSSNTAAGDTTAFLYSPVAGTMIDLGDLAGGGGIHFSEGAGINASGQITGAAATANGRDHAFFWDGTMHDLGTLGGPFSDGRGINAAGQIVGTSQGVFAGQRAFLYTKTSGMVDLNTLLPSGSGWDLDQANAINDAGQITGFGTKTTCGSSSCVVLSHAYLMTPPPPPMGAIIIGSAVAKPPTGTADAVFTVSFFNTGNQPVLVDFSTADVTARAGRDYAAASGTLPFGPGVTTQDITVHVIGGAPNASHLTFSVVLSNAGSVLASGTGTILVPAHPPQIAYTMSASPSSLSIGALSDQSSVISLHSDNGITEAASVSAGWIGAAPTGVTFSFFPVDVNILGQASASASTTLTVRTSGSPSAGLFHLRVTGTSDSGVIRSVDVTVVISSTLPGTCCRSSGPFVDPAPGVDADVEPDGGSPSGRYRATSSGGIVDGPANVEVTTASGQHLIYAVATNWGFSPDDDRFVTSSITGSGSASIHQVALYDLTSATQQTPIWSSGDLTASSRIQFSPSGRYLFYTDVLGGPRTQLTLVNARTGTVVFSASFPQVGGAPIPDEDSFGIIGWGFGPNDSRFVYAYLSGPNAVEWNLVNLEKGPGRAGVKSVSLLNDTADFWQFSSCGEVIALVRQPGQQFVFVDLYHTSDGSPVGNEVQIAAPGQQLELHTTSTGHVATVNGTLDYLLSAVTPDCSAPAPPPPPSPTCCTSAGPFVDPAPGVHIDTQTDGTSPSGKYNATPAGGTENGPVDVKVTRASGQPLLTTPATYWAFSPDDDRFVTHFVQGSGPGSVLQVALFDLTRANPQAPIWTRSDVTASARIQFSPSGRYLFYTDIVGGPTTQLTVVDAHTGTPVFSASFPQLGGAPIAGEDSFGTVGWGFGPNDTRFVYAYLSGRTTVEWNLVNLEKGPVNPGVKSLTLLNATADYWQFSSCGEVIALVHQPGQQFVFVDLYHTNDGTSAGTEVQIPAPVQPLELHTTTAHVAAVNGTANYTLGTVTQACTISASAHSPVDILIVDEQGRRTGFDSRSGTAVNEIPGGSFTGVGTEPETVTVPYVKGTYRLEAYGLPSLTTPEPFRLSIVTAGETDVDEHDIAGIASSRTLQQFVFTVDDHLQVTSLSAVDTTPPVITPTVLGTVGKNGWYTSDVVIGWNVADGESPVQSSSGCASLVVNSDTAGVTFTCSATSAGGTASNSITVKRDTAPPGIAIAAPANGAVYPANQSVAASYSCADSGSGLAGCNGTVANGARIDTTPNGVSTSKSFTVNATDTAGNAATRRIDYVVSCHYVEIGVSPGTVKRPGVVTVTANVMSCTSSSQAIQVKFELTGPHGPNACGSAKTLMFTTPLFTIPKGTSKTISFPFIVPKSMCEGTYSITSTTLINGASVDATTATLTVR